MTTAADQAVTHYQFRLHDLLGPDGDELIPLFIPMSRLTLIDRLERAQIAEIRDPDPPPAP